MPGVLVDGNDLLAVYRVTSDAVERARRGGGPTLIEALTYRIGPHTTADDPGRYRSEDDVEPWRRRDPLHRVRTFLESAGVWDEAAETDAEEEASAEVEAAVATAEALAPLGGDEIFAAMFAAPTTQLERQRARLAAEGR
jgi:pyruvate dehydrogenase E1 component alpha subunit